jgi:trehalose synthase
MDVWNYLKKFIIKYNYMIISMKKFAKKIDIPQRVIAPSIDPLSTKNCELSDSKINKYLKKFGIDQDKPFIAQVSRFDKWKDPIGVIKAYREIKRKIDCRLVLVGSMAIDDPEGQEIYHNIINKIGGEKDIILISSENNILVNAVQRRAEVIIQKSIKEGFGLTVSEALWKETPVVAGNVGGIPAQIINGKNGYLIENTQDCAKKVIKIMENPRLRKKMGKYGREHVRKNFLITRHLQDYINLFNSVLR